MMNTKRQTIWLVSMLSLMVVLSAYYLFTEEIGGKDKVSEISNLQNVVEMSGDSDNSVAGLTTGEEDATSEYTLSAEEQAVLKQLNLEGYFETGQFSELYSKREQKLEQEENRLNAVIADVNTDAETSISALAEMEELEDNMTKISKLEEELMQTYEVALISLEAEDKYKVVVTSDLPVKKEAAKIIDQVITVMDIRPEQVSVNFVPNP